jgi:hypothetical protein
MVSVVLLVLSHELMVALLLLCLSSGQYLYQLFLAMRLSLVYSPD